MKSIVIILPNSMAVRSVFESEIFDLLKKKNDRVIFLLPNVTPAMMELSDGLSTQIRNIYSPRDGGDKLTLWSRICRSLWWRLFKIVRADFGNLVFRFNHLQGFQGHKQKMMMPPERRKREAQAGNYSDKMLGVPFLNSRKLFRLLFRFHHFLWQYNNPEIEKFVSEINPDRMVFWHVQDPSIKPYSLAARRRAIPSIAVLGSWDRPTTKGPIYPDIEHYIVNNVVMKGELEKYHGIATKEIEVVGWPQMDCYCDENNFSSKELLFAEVGVPVTYKLIVYTGNCARLGPHEPSIVEHIDGKIRDHYYGDDCMLVVRPHPQDGEWAQRYEKVLGMSQVKVLPAEMGRLNFLASLLNYADVVIAAQGSVSLDAVALDSCTVNIAFDGNLHRSKYESVRLWYEMDHYRPVVESGGVWVVNSFDEMDAAIEGYMKNPQFHADGRQRLRELELAPLDGHSSERIVESLLR